MAVSAPAVPQPYPVPTPQQVATRAGLISRELAASGRVLADLRLDPTAQVDAATAYLRLTAALRLLEADQQQTSSRSGASLPTVTVSLQQPEALAARARFYVDQLALRWQEALNLALTPLPVAWLAEVFDALQVTSLNAPVHPYDPDRGHRAGSRASLVWTAMACAADALAGTGQLPAPWRPSWWLRPAESSRGLATSKRPIHRGDLVDQPARIRREAHWRAAESMHGSSHHDGVPVERFVPAWGLRDGVAAITGADFTSHATRARFGRLIKAAEAVIPTTELLHPWPRREARVQEAQERLDRLEPGWDTRLRRTPLRPLGGARRFFLDDDLIQRATWRAHVLAGGDCGRARRLEERLLADALDQFVLRTLRGEATCLPAASAWRSRLTQLRPGHSWQPHPDAVDGRATYATLLGYSPARLRADAGLAACSVDELAAAVELTGGTTYR